MPTPLPAAARAVGAAVTWERHAVLAERCSWEGLARSSTSKRVLRNKHSAVVHKDRMIVFGGHDLREMTFMDDLLVYHIPSDSWEFPVCTGPAPCPRRAHGAAVVGDHMIICGGFAGGYGGNGCMDDVYALDLVEWRWQRLETRGQGPCSRGGHSAVVDADTGCVIVHGGWDTSLAYHSDVWRLRCDFARDACEWTELTAESAFVPEARVGHRAVMHGNTMIVSGGYGGDRYWDDLNGFDLSTRQWHRLNPTSAGAPRPAARTYHALECRGDKLLVIGGSDSRGEMSDVWVFDLTTRQWTQAECNGLREGRFAHTSVTHGSDVLIYGGISQCARQDAEADYRESTDLIRLRAECWAADKSLLHTMRRYVAQHANALTLDDTCALPPSLVSSLLDYVRGFAPGALPYPQALLQARRARPLLPPSARACTLRPAAAPLTSPRPPPGLVRAHPPPVLPPQRSGSGSSADSSVGYASCPASPSRQTAAGSRSR